MTTRRRFLTQSLMGGAALVGGMKAGAAAAGGGPIVVRTWDFGKQEKTPHVTLAGEGALQFALANGFRKEDLLERIIRRHPSKAKDIQVGFLALNKKGEYGAFCLQKGFTYAVRSEREEKMYDGKSIY
jgi:isoaspartyl peptidase/L-asparaginase-like protein (Ntn-hydrolase superfamily)